MKFSPSECENFNTAERICDRRDSLKARHREQLLKDICKSKDLVRCYIYVKDFFFIALPYLKF